LSAHARGWTAQIAGNFDRLPITGPFLVWICYGPGGGVGSAPAGAESSAPVAMSMARKATISARSSKLSKVVNTYLFRRLLGG
jgi:hypothetical protein